MVSKHILGAICALHGLAGDFRLGAVSTDDGPRPNPCRYLALFAIAVDDTELEVDHAHAVVVARDAFKSTHPAHRTAGGGALAQPFVELVAIDHADKAVFDRDVHPHVLGRDHTRGSGMRHEQLIRNGEIFDEPWWYGAPTWLGAACPIEQQHRATGPCEIVRRRGSCRAATYYNDVKCFCLAHAVTS